MCPTPDIAINNQCKQDARSFPDKRVATVVSKDAAKQVLGMFEPAYKAHGGGGPAERHRPAGRGSATKSTPWNPGSCSKTLFGVKSLGVVLSANAAPTAEHSSAIGVRQRGAHPISEQKKMFKIAFRND